jgi:hypothetical protein
MELDQTNARTNASGDIDQGLTGTPAQHSQIARRSASP